MLFNKAVTFTDLHFGRRANDWQANNDNEQFIDWMIDKARTWGAETAIFMGDWHDHRASVHVSTLNSSLNAMEKLNRSFNRVFFIVGNHDLFYREKRDLNSVEFGRNLNNIVIIHDALHQDGVSIVPWLVGDEWKEMRNIKSRYVFGHFELPHFMMNAKVEMPDHGGINAEQFEHPEYVFSGHFHMRQQKKNVVYTGNAFPFTYSDAWDDDRGCMFLEWGKQPVFHSWPDQPVFRTATLSELIDTPTKFFREKASLRVTIDIDINYEEAQLLRDSFIKDYGVRRIDLIHAAKTDAQQYDSTVAFQSVDQMVIDGLGSVESVGLDKNLLIDIYRSL